MLLKSFEDVFEMKKKQKEKKGKLTLFSLFSPEGLGYRIEMAD